MNKDEALKMAIEAMEYANDIILNEFSKPHDESLDAIKACKETLAQSAQQPINNCPNCNSWFTKEIHSIPAPSWQGLDEDEFIYFTHWVDADTLAEIEQTLKEKNT